MLAFIARSLVIILAIRSFLLGIRLIKKHSKKFSIPTRLAKFKLMQKSLKKNHDRRFRSQLLVTVDLYAVGSAAGMTFREITQIIGENQSDLISHSLTQIQAKVDSGESLGKAQSEESKRVNIPEFSTFCSIISQGYRLGIPISSTLEQFSQNLRAQENSQKRQRAAKTGPLAGLVTALITAPACVVLLFTLAVGGLLAGPSSVPL